MQEVYVGIECMSRGKIGGGGGLRGPRPKIVYHMCLQVCPRFNLTLRQALEKPILKRVRFISDIKIEQPLMSNSLVYEDTSKSKRPNSEYPAT